MQQSYMKNQYIIFEIHKLPQYRFTDFKLILCLNLLKYVFRTSFLVFIPKLEGSNIHQTEF